MDFNEDLKKTPSKKMTSSPRPFTRIFGTALAKELGSDRSKLIWVNVWLADIRDIDDHNEAWDAWIDPENPPARACVEARLGHSFQKVEIAAIAEAE